MGGVLLKVVQAFCSPSPYTPTLKSAGALGVVGGREGIKSLHITEADPGQSEVSQGDRGLILESPWRRGRGSNPPSILSLMILEGASAEFRVTFLPPNPLEKES